MGFIFIDAVKKTSDSFPAQEITTAAITTTVGQLAVVAMAGIFNTTQTVTDSKGNIWTPGNPVSTDGPSGTYISSMFSILTSAGTGHTFTFTSGNASDLPTMVVEVFSLDSGVIKYDQHNEGGYTTTTSVTGVSITSTNAIGLIIGILSSFNSTGTVITAGDGYTIPVDGKVDNFSSTVPLAIEYQLVSSIGTYTPGFTLSPADYGPVLSLNFTAGANAKLVKTWVE